ncbi:MAG: beta-lactamase family protein [Sphingomonadales bacterium]|nr:beta-lactamase family protein [Sphingomonadales bacterium]
MTNHLASLTRRGLLAGSMALGLLPRGTRAAEAHGGTATWPCDDAACDALRGSLGSPALGFARDAAGAVSLTVSGWRMRGRVERALADDVWHWGSISKPVTATLIAQAVEAGELRWDDRPLVLLRDDLPDAHQGYAGVTLLHLLSHRAGLAPMASDVELLFLPRTEDDARASRLIAARQSFARPPASRPGTQYAYGNRGYMIAAAMLEKAVGVPFEALMTQRLFAALGLASAGFGPPGTPGRLDQPVGHVSVGGKRTLTPRPPESPIADNPVAFSPAARVHMNLADMLRFLAAHRDRTALLSAASWQRLHTAPFGGDYALGWWLAAEGLTHSGSNTLWNADVLVAPRYVAAAATNDGDFDRVHPALHAAICELATLCGPAAGGGARVAGTGSARNGGS